MCRIPLEGSTEIDCSVSVLFMQWRQKGNLLSYIKHACQHSRSLRTEALTCCLTTPWRKQAEFNCRVQASQSNFFPYFWWTMSPGFHRLLTANPVLSRGQLPVSRVILSETDLARFGTNHLHGTWVDMCFFVFTKSQTCPLATQLMCIFAVGSWNERQHRAWLEATSSSIS